MKKLTLFIFVALLCTIEASAFTTKYHATIAYIAEQHMTPKARANFRKAFGNHPLAEFSSYPDFYRAIYRINGERLLHFVYLDENFYPVPSSEDRYSSYDALLRAVDQLKDYKNLDDSVKTIALAMVAHFVGDVHCPSHKVYADGRSDINNIYYKPYFYKSGDGKKVGYHAFWDSICMDERYDGGFMEVAYMLDTCSEEEIREIQKGSIVDWIHSTALDCKDLYDVKEGDIVDRVYYTNKAGAAGIQVRNAGYRLAALMNRIFG